MVYRLRRQPATFITHGSVQLHILHIAVDAEVRRIGIGSLLLRTVEADAQALGVAEVALETWGFNVEAQHFFRAIGYEPLQVLMRKKVGARTTPS